MANVHRLHSTTSSVQVGKGVQNLSVGSEFPWAGLEVTLVLGGFLQVLLSGRAEGLAGKDLEGKLVVVKLLGQSISSVWLDKYMVRKGT